MEAYEAGHHGIDSDCAVLNLYAHAGQQHRALRSWQWVALFRRCQGAISAGTRIVPCELLADTHVGCASDSGTVRSVGHD